MLLKFRVNLRGNRNANFNGVWRGKKKKKSKKSREFYREPFHFVFAISIHLTNFFFIPFFNLKETRTDESYVRSTRTMNV